MPQSRAKQKLKKQGLGSMENIFMAATAMGTDIIIAEVNQVIHCKIGGKKRREK